MLVLFIGIMVYVVSVADKASKVKNEDLVFKAQDLTKNMVVQMQPGDLTLNVDNILAQGISNWQDSQQREKFAKENEAGTYSDLVVAMRIAACPHCKAFVPRYYFRSNFQCPACADKLADVPARPKTRRRIITENDLDGDGMPNSYETSQGFNPNNPDDQLADKDKDGFSNLFEYENDTDPKVARSRSPLWYRMRYGAMESVVLPVRLNSVSTMNSKDKKKWFLQINILKVDKNGAIRKDKNNNPIGESTDFHIGDQIKIEDRVYRFVDATFKKIPVGKEKYDDQSTVTLLQELSKGAKIKPDKLVLSVEREVRSNDKRLIIEDVGYPVLHEGKGLKENGRPFYHIRVGHSIELGNTRTGKERYTLVSVNEQAKTAFFSRTNVTKGDATKDSAGKKIVVTQYSEIPEDLQVLKNAGKNKSAQGVTARNIK